MLASRQPGRATSCLGSSERSSPKVSTRCAPPPPVHGCTHGRAPSAPVVDSSPVTCSGLCSRCSTIWMVEDVEVHPDDRPYAWAEVDLRALRHNAALLADRPAPSA